MSASEDLGLPSVLDGASIDSPVYTNKTNNIGTVISKLKSAKDISGLLVGGAEVGLPDRLDEMSLDSPAPTTSVIGRLMCGGGCGCTKDETQTGGACGGPHEDEKYKAKYIKYKTKYLQLVGKLN